MTRPDALPLPQLLLLLLLYASQIHAADTDNWQAALAEDPLTGKSTCLLISAERQSYDGQGKTAIQLIYNGQALIARTRSNIDLSYPGVGLQVDNYDPQPIDRLLGETSVVFDSQPDKIRDQFIQGRRARLALGFWPTWPKTKTVITEFNLLGFTRAWQRFQQCQKSGELP